MVKVEIETVQKVVAAIKDERNPQAQLEAISMRERWLAEVDAGLLQMSDEAREILQAA
ncbi:hypothetical protein [Paraburkholderia atlantica]|uniref:Uncharacterized protein n=1 Tax=Paraburkholderia atlantica TaxID=2654982 RepID=D5WNL4_PARAM|nr:hypothetical protein [Paraburkholderia atlantica]ADG20893.1 hypothetical protein BC1002_7147 [Paraburkholderia atlantica]MBB5510970.1 hypothetical protein [Paraburkholderia atlantica]